MSQFKRKELRDIDHVDCFVQTSRFSSCLISSSKSCVQTTLRWIWFKMDQKVLHKLVEFMQLECTLLLRHSEIYVDFPRFYFSLKLLTLICNDKYWLPLKKKNNAEFALVLSDHTAYIACLNYTSDEVIYGVDVYVHAVQTAMLIINKNNPWSIDVLVKWGWWILGFHSITQKHIILLFLNQFF